MCMYAYINKQARKTRPRKVWGGCSPRKFLEIRSSEVASAAIFGQKQSRSSYYQFLAACICYAIAIPNVKRIVDGSPDTTPPF